MYSIKEILRKLKMYQNLLNRNQKRHILAYVILLVFVSILDLSGVLLMGAIGVIALSATGISDATSSPIVMKLLNSLQISNANFRLQLLFLGIIAVTLFTSKSLLSLMILKKLYKYLAKISNTLSEKIFEIQNSMTFDKIQQETVQFRLLRSSVGIDALAFGVFGSAITAFSEIFLLAILGFSLLSINFFGTIATLIFFSLMAYVSHKLTSEKAQQIGKKRLTNSIEFNERFVEFSALYRELHLMGKVTEFTNRILANRQRNSAIESQSAYLPNISKNLIEVSLVFGVFLIIILQIIVDDIQQSISSLAIFLAAGGRIAPSLIKLQQNLLSLNNNSAQAEATIALLANSKQEKLSPRLQSQKTYETKISINKLTYMHNSSSKPILNEITEDFQQGEIIALIGDSGSGKTTLMNLLIGVLIPTTGTIKIGDVPVNEFILQNPNFIGFVPQEIKIIKGTVAENIIMSTSTSVKEEEIWQVLRDVKLDQKIGDFPSGIFEKISEDGNNLSGGERQRLGLARALIGNPQILFLDEATSSLDPNVEKEVLCMLEKYRGKMTILFITHRESTFSLADRVLRLSDKGILSMDSHVK